MISLFCLEQKIMMDAISRFGSTRQEYFFSKASMNVEFHKASNIALDTPVNYTSVSLKLLF